MGVLDGLGAVAATLVDTVGLGSRAATLVRTTGNSYDPATGTHTGGATTNYACRAVLVRSEASQVPSTLIEQGDEIVLVARSTLGITPDPDSDTLTWNGVSWAIKGVYRYQTGDQDAAYELHLGR